MAFRNRLLIGLSGRQPDVHLLRYASMVARLKSGPPFAATRGPLRHSACESHLLATPSAGNCPSRLLADDDPEVRFVYLSPRPAMAQPTDPPQRSELRNLVQEYFGGPSLGVAVGCDLLKGDPLQRLPSLAADFDGDLLLMGDGAWPRWQLGRLAMQAPCPLWLVPPAWAPVIRRVLVPIDFSPGAAGCIRAAIDLTQHAPQSKCLALHVYRHEGRFFDRDIDRVSRQALVAKYRSFLAGIDTRGVALEPMFVHSHRVDRAIARVAQEVGADVVIMSSRGRSRSAGLMHPSTTERAIRQCRTSVLVLKSSGEALGLWDALKDRLRSNDTIQFS
jgi:nucleotide-binding universal stress UspA family protein